MCLIAWRTAVEIIRHTGTVVMSDLLFASSSQKETRSALDWVKVKTRQVKDSLRLLQVVQGLFKMQGLHFYKQSSNWIGNVGENVLRSSCEVPVINVESRRYLRV